MFNFKTITILAAALSCLFANAHASDSLSYSGRLVNSNGSPVTGPVNLKFDFAYTNATTSILCTEQISAVALSNGVFHVKLDPDCTPSSWMNVLSNIPSSEALAIRVTDESNTKTYSFQALHSMPLASMSQIAKQLPQMGASVGQVLSWDGSQWTPTDESGTGNGSVTSIATGAGLAGGPITTTGTISIADGGVTDQKIASGISRNKLANGSASHVLVNDGSGAISSVAQLSVAQGGTGASTAAGARTNLELGTAAVVDLGVGVGKAMPSDGVPVCMSFEKLQMTAGPAFAWACVADNDSADNTKLPLDGSAPMTGALDMNSHKILGVTSPTNPGEAANKAYVDAQIGSVNASQWITNGSNVHYDTGNVGIGIATPDSPLSVQVKQGVVQGISLYKDDVPTTDAYFKITNATSAANSFLPIFNSKSNSTTASYANGFVLDTNSDAVGEGVVASFMARTSNAAVTNRDLFDFANYAPTPTPGGNSVMRIKANGNIGIGNIAPSEKLDVTGNIALSGRVRMKSDNANYVELQAPAGLATTLNFKFPSTAGAAGNAIITDGAGNLSWSTVATGSSGVGGDLTGTIDNAQIAAGAITNTEVAAGAAIAQSKIANLTTDLAAKEPTINAGTTAQYWRGDKSWQTLDTGAVPEGTRLYFTEPRVLGTDLAGFTSGAGVITSADTILSAFGKLDGNIAGLATAATSDFVNVTGDTMTGSLVLNADPTVALGAATKQYVDSQVTGSTHWTKTGSVVHYDGGRVGIGTNAPTSKFVVAGATPEATSVSGDNSMTLFGDGHAYYIGRDITNDVEFVFGTSIGDEVFSGSMTVHDYTLRTNNQKRLTVKADGKVGIGTTTPDAKLEVYGSGSEAKLKIRSPSINNGDSASILFAVDSSSTAVGAKIQHIRTDSYDRGALSFFTNNTANSSADNSQERMRINAAGNVGIGTISPGDKLDVAGNISLTGAVKLKSDTANFVQLFAPASLASTLNLVWPGTAGASGNALTTDGSGNLSWSAVATTATTVGGDLTGTIANAQIAAGAITNADVSATAAIAQSKIANLTTDLAAKEPSITAGTSAQYWRGDKTWQTLNTTAVPEGTNLYFLDSRVRAALMSGYAVGTAVPLAATDTLIQAIGKLEAQIIANDTAFDSTGQWSKNANKIYYNADFVGVGTNNPVGPIHVYSNSPEAMILERSNANNSHIQYKNTIGNIFAGLSGDGNYAIGPNVNLNSGAYMTLNLTTQNLGLGTGLSAPGAKLTVAGDNKRIMLQSATQNIADSNSIDFSETAGAATHMRIRYDGNIVNSTDGRLVFAAPSESLDNILVLDRSGKVGIGTNAASAQLHIGKSEAAAGTNGSIDRLAIQPYGHTGGPFKFVAKDVSADAFLELKYGTAVNPIMSIEDTGQIGFGIQPKLGTTSRIQTNSDITLATAGSANTLHFNSFWDTSWKAYNSGYSGAVRFDSTNGQLQFWTSPASVAAGAASNLDHAMVISPARNVGIGTSTPAVKLHISAGSEGQAGPVEAMRISGPNSPANANSAQDIRFRFASAGSTGIRAYRGGTWDTYLEFLTNPAAPNQDAPIVRMHISESGNVGINTQAPSEKLEVVGNVKATNFLYTSDSRLKRDVASIKDPIEKLNKLRGVNFKWKENDEKAVGFIAQEVEKVFPELVRTDKKTGYKSVQYANIVAVLVEGFKKHFDQTEKEKAELEKKNKELERKISSLEKENELMNDRLDRIEQRLNQKK